MNSNETKGQVSPEHKYDERRRAFLKKAAIVAAATPLITTLLMGQNSAYASNPWPCCKDNGGQVPCDPVCNK